MSVEKGSKARIEPQRKKCSYKKSTPSRAVTRVISGLLLHYFFERPDNSGEVRQPLPQYLRSPLARVPDLRHRVG